MTDIVPATDEQIARLEWWLSRAVQFLDSPGEQKWFTLPDVNADELSTLRGLIARIRAADADRANLRAMNLAKSEVIDRLKAELAKRDDALRALRKALEAAKQWLFLDDGSPYADEDTRALVNETLASTALGADHEQD